jgi:hypothetical protein
MKDLYDYEFFIDTRIKAHRMFLDGARALYELHYDHKNRVTPFQAMVRLHKLKKS